MFQLYNWKLLRFEHTKINRISLLTIALENKLNEHISRTIFTFSIYSLNF